MTDETRISDILAQAEEELARGQEPDLVALCCGDSLLLREVQKRLAQLRTIDGWRRAGVRVLPSAAVHPLLPPGYELVRELGGGNMGVVYLAHDAKGRAVAVKTLTRLEPNRLTFLRREFKALVDLRHENLVTIFEEWSDGTNWCCVMEYVEGRHFLNHIRSYSATASSDTTDLHDPLGTSNSVRFRSAFAQLARGIHALHSANKLHRDIKSSNVVVTGTGQVKLLDFGLVAEMDRMQGYQQSAVVGTMAYMSPEQCGGGHLTPASDWYSFGVLLYEALSGQLPVQGTIAEIINGKQTPPRRPSDFLIGVPSELEELCLELLQVDPVARPTGAEILRRLGGPAELPSVRRTTDDRRLLLGRERQLVELGEAAATVKRNRAPVVVEIHGSSGAGKSALVERFLREMQDSGEVVVLTGRCYEQSAVPYKAFDGLIDALCRYLRARSREQVEAVLPNYLAELARLFPILGRLEAVAEAPPVNVEDPHEVRRRAFQALRELLGRLGRRTPLVLFADDVQWGDRESAVLLTELVRMPDAPPLLFLASYRRGEASSSPFVPALKQLEIERRDLPVDPLEIAEARELAATLLGSSVGSVERLVEVIARESGGNPFIVHELVEFFRSRESVDPPTIGSVVRSRVGGLDAEARRLLEVIALSSGPLNAECAFRAADLPSERQAAALDTLITAKFVHTVGSGETRIVETNHDRIRETVAAELTTDIRIRHHRRIAIVRKAADDTEPEVLAYHFAQAGDRSQASHYHALAGELSAKALAFHRAAEHYRLALDGCSPSESRRRSWLLGQASALANAGLGQKSAAAFTEAAEHSSGTDRLFCLQRAAEQLVRCGRIDEGMVALRIVMLDAGIDLPSTERAMHRSLFWMRLRLWGRGLRFVEQPVATISAKTLLQIEICRWAASVIRLSDVLLGGWFHSFGLLLCLRTGDAHGVAQGIARELLIPTTFGNQTGPRIEQLHKHGMEVAARIANPEDREYTCAVLHLYRLIGYHVLGEMRSSLAAVPAAIDALQTCTNPSAAYQRGTLRLFEGVSLLSLGEVSRSRAVYEQNYRELVDAGNMHGMVTLPLMSRAHQFHLMDDRPQNARDLIQDAIGLWPDSGVYQQHFWAWVAETEVLLYEGRGQEAWELCRKRWDTVAQRRSMMIVTTRVIALWTRARCLVAGAAQLGSDDSTERHRLLRDARRIARQLERNRVPVTATPLGGSLHAAISHLEGDARAAVSYLERAENQFTSGGYVLHAASLMYRRGQLLGGDVGRALVAKAEAELTAREIRNPTRFIEIYATGCEGTVQRPRIPNVTPPV